MKAQYKENMANGPHRTDFNPMTSNTPTSRMYGVEGNGGGSGTEGGPSGKFLGATSTPTTYGTQGVGG